MSWLYIRRISLILHAPTRNWNIKGLFLCTLCVYVSAASFHLKFGKSFGLLLVILLLLH